MDLAADDAGDVFGAFAMTEPESGSDAYSLTTTAVRRDDGSYVLNGHKAYLTLGSRCAFVIVFASTTPGAGAWGLSTFLVPTDVDGVERVGNRRQDGHADDAVRRHHLAPTPSCRRPR